MKYTNWKELVSECKQSGMSQAAWCLEKGISLTTYKTWVQKLKQEKVTTQWASIETPTTVPIQTPAVQESIVLCCGKWTVKVPEKFDADYLADILKAVESLC